MSQKSHLRRHIILAFEGCALSYRELRGRAIRCTMARRDPRLTRARGAKSPRVGRKRKPVLCVRFAPTIALASSAPIDAPCLVHEARTPQQ